MVCSTSRAALTHGSEKWEEIYTACPINAAEPSFGKILIANRGEIACRVIRTARKMGIKTVAVYSEADARSLFVRMADEAILIGPPPARESYLVMEKILDAVKQTGAEAVHPGYGFLSENTTFVAELERAKVTFIGPNSAAIRDMGDKLASKRLATKAGVNGIPGFDGVVENVEHCVELARDIGYPVMVKASAGGGGKGMRVASNDDEAKEAFILCSEESAASFGDDRMLIEKFVNKPRHIEIQVLGDKHGNVIYLNERECSIQRRNQKVIEEAPSPFLDPQTRKAMGEQAVSLSTAIGYDSAGTVEFLMDNEKNFYFLEMNTRLQVEHPITECITGVDLVQQMIRSAYGHKLALKQEDIEIRGWAIESRIYAEDPYKNFGMPSIGRLHGYQEPSGLEGVRCDSGIDEGSVISMYYDPMICKLTAYGKTRDEAIKTSVGALDHYVIRGVTHNIPLLRDILTEPTFLSGTFTTNYLPETYPDGFKGTHLSAGDMEELASVAAVYYVKEELRLRSDSSSILSSWDLVVCIQGQDVSLKIKPDTDALDANHWMIQIKGGQSLRLKNDLSQWDKVSHVELANSNTIQLISKSFDNCFRIRYRGTALNATVVPQHIASYRGLMKEKPKVDASRTIMAPMPGTVKSVAVEVGQMIGEGLECCVLEAMKMQNSLKVGATGKVKAVHVKPGDTVQADQILVEIE
jgi:propionyl-CoA carboxylase alpha chain